MKTGFKIALASATGLGIGIWLHAKSKARDEDCSCNHDNDLVKKIVGGDKEDAFDPILIQRIKAGLTPSNLKLRDQYIKDLERWGTKQGLIDVSNDEKAKKKKKKLYAKMAKAGKAVSSKYLKAKKKEFAAKGQKVDTREKLLKALAQDYEKTQITIRNDSDNERPITLFESNRSASVSPPAPEDVQDHTILKEISIPFSVGSGIHPQGMAINPANGFTYIANQLSNNVSVVGTDGQVVKVIQLQPSNFPGYNSPVDVAVNTNTNSPNYGKIYVVGSVSNTVSVIDLLHNVTDEIPVGVRPLAIAFNPINEKIYVANLVSNEVSAIETSTLQVSVLPVGKDPIGVGVNTANGDVFITNSSDNSVTVINSNDQVTSTIANIGNRPVSATYQPANDEMYVVATGSNEVIPINATDYSALPSIAVGNSPYGIAFNSNNNFLYVANRDDNNFSIIAPDKSLKDTISIGEVNIGFVINQSNNLLFTNNTGSGTVKLIGYEEQTGSIQIDEDFAAKRQEFQHNPVVIKHAKFILSGEERFKVLTLRESSALGNQKRTTLSFTNYNHPRNFQNVSEVDGLEGSVIDGQNGWQFMIAPKQTITLMVYYRQFDMYNLLPEQARKSTGVTLSNGLPDGWKKALKKSTNQKSL